MKKNVYTVEKLNSYIANMFDQDFLLSAVSIKGEVSNCKYHRTGHIYFTLKDKNAAIRAVMFASDARRGLDFEMKDGDQVVVSGRVGVYEKNGDYQIYASLIERGGIGELYEEFERLKKELSEMGMFAPEYKLPIPAYVSRVGVVTAPQGAALQDIINISGRRNPYVQLILSPALVQGEFAAESVASAIRRIDAYAVDVIIVARGGGSLEDLMAFNTELVARAIFECSTPVISAVGHETDVTIADLVADLRAPTPSAAAELAVYNVRELLEDIEEKKSRFESLMRSVLNRYKALVSDRAGRLERMSPGARLSQKRYFLSESQLRLDALMDRAISRTRDHIQKNVQRVMDERLDEALSKRRYRLSRLSGKLDELSPLKRLRDGYSWAMRADGRNITSIQDVERADEIRLAVSDGVISAVVSGKEQDGRK